MTALKGTERLRAAGTDAFVVGAIVLWMLYSVNGFRPPTQPITLSDENAGSGVRQLLFTAAGLLSAKRLLFTGSLSQVIGVRFLEFCIWGMLVGSVIWSADSVLTIKRSTIFLFGLLTLATATHMTRRPARLMLMTVTIFTGFVAWSSILFHFALPKECTVNPARPGLAGIAGHPNTLAPFLVIGFVFSLGLTAKGNFKTWLRIIQVGQLLATVMTQSITSLSLLLVSIGVYVFLSFPPARRGQAKLTIATLALLVFAIGPGTIRDSLFAATGRDASLSGRDQLWACVTEEVRKRPLFGHGYGAFWYEGRGRELVNTWNPRQSHNAYLDIATDLGLLGLIFVIFAFPMRAFDGWLRFRGPECSPQRRAAASLVAVSVGTLFVYAMAQSYFFKMDSFPFLAFFWSLLLLTNRDSNSLDREFAGQAAGA